MASRISGGHSLIGSGGIAAPSGVSPTVHADALPRDVAGFVAHEERARGGDVLWATGAAHGCRLLVILDLAAEIALALGAPQHGRDDEPGRDGVHGDALRAELERQRLGE